MLRTINPIIDNTCPHLKADDISGIKNGIVPIISKLNAEKTELLQKVQSLESELNAKNNLIVLQQNEIDKLSAKDEEIARLKAKIEARMNVFYFAHRQVLYAVNLKTSELWADFVKDGLALDCADECAQGDADLVLTDTDEDEAHMSEGDREFWDAIQSNVAKGDKRIALVRPEVRGGTSYYRGILTNKMYYKGDDGLLRVLK